MRIDPASAETMRFLTHGSLSPGYNEPCILPVEDAELWNL